MGSAHWRKGCHLDRWSQAPAVPNPQAVPRRCPQPHLPTLRLPHTHLQSISAMLPSFWRTHRADLGLLATGHVEKKSTAGRKMPARLSPTRLQQHRMSCSPVIASSSAAGSTKAWLIPPGVAKSPSNIPSL